MTETCPLNIWILRIYIPRYYFFTTQTYVNRFFQLTLKVRSLSSTLLLSNSHDKLILESIFHHTFQWENLLTNQIYRIGFNSGFGEQCPIAREHCCLMHWVYVQWFDQSRKDNASMRADTYRYSRVPRNENL